ncbi:hypothetical protein CDAR_81961 [Caerostris darwini]|uniref:Uncharacterized protein n=1 Tax=Caerostris darwini TaxID=1538125 RepID=A0AAV4V6V1_9ARAC|nr:hypothetical protein CDAR_81961 [Caerostris darwini]
MKLSGFRTRKPIRKPISFVPKSSTRRFWNPSFYSVLFLRWEVQQLEDNFHVVGTFRRNGSILECDKLHAWAAACCVRIGHVIVFHQWPLVPLVCTTNSALGSPFKGR